MRNKSILFLTGYFKAQSRAGVRVAVSVCHFSSLGSSQRRFRGVGLGVRLYGSGLFRVEGLRGLGFMGWGLVL